MLVGAALAAAVAYLLMAGTRSAIAATLQMAVEAFAVAAGSVVSISLRQAAVTAGRLRAAVAGPVIDLRPVAAPAAS